MSTPNYQFGQPKWKREGWYSPTQQHKPKYTTPSEVVRDPTPVPDPVPSSDLKFNGVDLEVAKTDGYLLVTTLMKAGKAPLGRSFQPWARTAEGKKTLNAIAAGLGLRPAQLWRVENRRTTYIHPGVAREFVKAFSPELYEYLKSAAPDPTPTVPTVSTVSTKPDDTAPSARERELEARITSLEAQLTKLLPLIPEVQQLQAQLKSLPSPEQPQPQPRKSFYSVASWISLKGIRVGDRGSAGKALTRYCNENGLQYNRVETDGGPFPFVNEYPIQALDDLDWSRF